jgi:hypothetical protein
LRHPLCFFATSTNIQKTNIIIKKLLMRQLLHVYIATDTGFV